jgi:DNA repair protein RecO (recombination protein O)
MTANADILQPAFVLHCQHYRETSLILQVLTRDAGRVALLAKGVRKARSKTAALLQPFLPLQLSYQGKAELKNLTHVESLPPFGVLQGLPLYCGFYANELLGRFLHPYDPHPEVFSAYQQCLVRLATGGDMHIALRLFELELLEHSGYGLDFAYTAGSGLAIEADQRYVFQAGRGLVADSRGPISGATLQALGMRDFSQAQVVAEAKLLMRIVIDSYLQGRPLKSRAVIQQIINSS